MVYYCHITDGVIDQGPAGLPANLKGLASVELSDQNWVPVEEIQTNPTADQTYTGTDLTVFADKVVMEAKYRAMTPAEIKDVADVKIANKLEETDVDMARVAEDIAVAMINGTAVPQAAKDKINVRRALRGEDPVV